MKLILKSLFRILYHKFRMFEAALAQLGERQTEDLKAPCSIHGGGILFHIVFILKIMFYPNDFHQNLE